MIKIGERKQVGLIHHFTSVENLEGIIGDALYLRSNRGYISFTRNWLLGNQLDFKSANVRFTFYGDELSDRYKIEPFYDAQNMDTMGDERQQGRQEAEEMIAQSEIYIEPKHLAGIQFKFRNIREVAEIIGMDETFELKEWMGDNNVSFKVEPKWMHPKKMVFV